MIQKLKQPCKQVPFSDATEETFKRLNGGTNATLSTNPPLSTTKRRKKQASTKHLKSTKRSHSCLLWDEGVQESVKRAITDATKNRRTIKRRRKREEKKKMQQNHYKKGPMLMIYRSKLLMDRWRSYRIKCGMSSSNCNLHIEKMMKVNR